MDLDIFAGLPAYSASIAGRVWKFTEIDLAGLADLQSWLRANVPNPLAAVKEHLAGLAPDERGTLLETARREALEWPPKVGTQDAAVALLQSEEAQAMIIGLALRAHHPELTDVHARRLFKALRAEAAAWDKAEAEAAKAEAKAAAAAGRPPAYKVRDFPKTQRVIATAFGMPYDEADDQAEGQGGPKAAGPDGGDGPPPPSTT